MRLLEKVRGTSLVAGGLVAVLLSLQASAFTDEERIRWKKKKAAEKQQQLIEACREDPELEGCDTLELPEQEEGEEESDQQEKPVPGSEEPV